MDNSKVPIDSNNPQNPNSANIKKKQQPNAVPAPNGHAGGIIIGNPHKINVDDNFRVLGSDSALPDVLNGCVKSNYKNLLELLLLGLVFISNSFILPPFRVPSLPYISRQFHLALALRVSPLLYERRYARFSSQCPTAANRDHYNR